MHQQMRDQLEKALSGSADESAVRHLTECPDCSVQFQAFLDQARAVRTLRAPAESEPRAGFYARVMERIEAQGASIWDLFFESALGRRIAFASLTLAVLLGFAFVSAERSEAPELSIADQQIDMPSVGMPTVTSVGVSSVTGQLMVPDQDSVLANLVTYQEQ
jgi:hypothetical protein